MGHRIDQEFSSVATDHSHLGRVKARRDSDFISLRCVLGEVLFESSPGNSDVQSPTRITGLNGYSDS